MSKWRIYSKTYPHPAYKGARYWYVSSPDRPLAAGPYLESRWAFRAFRILTEETP